MLLSSPKRARRRVKETTEHSSVTPIPEKVIEQIILEVITKHVEKKKLIRSSQHGFIKGKSC